MVIIVLASVSLIIGIIVLSACRVSYSEQD